MLSILGVTCASNSFHQTRRVVEMLSCNVWVIPTKNQHRRRLGRLARRTALCRKVVLIRFEAQMTKLVAICNRAAKHGKAHESMCKILTLSPLSLQSPSQPGPLVTAEGYMSPTRSRECIFIHPSSAGRVLSSTITKTQTPAFTTHHSAAAVAATPTSITDPCFRHPKDSHLSYPPRSTKQ